MYKNVVKLFEAGTLRCFASNQANVHNTDTFKESTCKLYNCQ